MRKNNRKPEELRLVKMTPNFTEYAEGSVLVEFGATRVLCTATIDPNLPKWLQGGGQGWVTAEYGMLPRSTQSRITREKANQSGRSQEISRLIGRSLRAAVNMKKLGEKQIIVDCDVIQADGGTRTTAITGGFVALALALKRLHDVGEIKAIPLKHYVAAISVGLKNNETLLDLDYDEDSSISTDMNFVMCSNGGLIEVQGTAEGAPFSKEQLSEMLQSAESGCKKLFEEQAKIIGTFFPLQ